MIRQPVPSSNISEAGHDPHTNTMELKFANGRVYSYDNVNADEFNAMLSAQSVGSYFSNVLRPVKAGRIVMTDPTTGQDV